MANPPRDIIGKPQLPIPQGYVCAALALIDAGATALKGLGVVTPQLPENHITYYLADEMEKAQRHGIGKALIVEARSNTRAHPTDPTIRGEIDIKFRWNQYPSPNDRYLAVEAKKLRGKGNSLADKYVTGGVFDFVSGKYSRGHDCGIMLGYVVMPPTIAAISRVAAAMAKRKVVTRERSSLVADSSLCGHKMTYVSIHGQAGTAAAIKLIHLFLDFC